MLCRHSHPSVSSNAASSLRAMWATSAIPHPQTPRSLCGQSTEPRQPLAPPLAHSGPEDHACLTISPAARCGWEHHPSVRRQEQAAVPGAPAGAQTDKPPGRGMSPTVRLCLSGVTEGWAGTASEAGSPEQRKVSRGRIWLGS